MGTERPLERPFFTFRNRRPHRSFDLHQRRRTKMDERIKALFADYGKSFSALALQDQAQLYAESFIAAGPKGIISSTRDEFLKNADKAAAFYRKVGQESAEIKSMKETW